MSVPSLIYKRSTKEGFHSDVIREENSSEEKKSWAEKWEEEILFNWIFLKEGEKSEVRTWKQLMNLAKDGTIDENCYIARAEDEVWEPVMKTKLAPYIGLNAKTGFGDCKVDGVTLRSQIPRPYEFKDVPKRLDYRLDYVPKKKEDIPYGELLFYAVSFVVIMVLWKIWAGM